MLLVGAGGTGKTTALLQIASDLVADGRRVLVRSPGAPLDPSAVVELARRRGSWSATTPTRSPRRSRKSVEQLAADRSPRRPLAARAPGTSNGRPSSCATAGSWNRRGSASPTSGPLLGNRATALNVTAEAAEASAGLAAWAAAGAHDADAPAILSAWAAAGALGALAAVPDSGTSGRPGGALDQEAGDLRCHPARGLPRPAPRARRAALVGGRGGAPPRRRGGAGGLPPGRGRPGGGRRRPRPVRAGRPDRRGPRPPPRHPGPADAKRAWPPAAPARCGPATRPWPGPRSSCWPTGVWRAIWRTCSGAWSGAPRPPGTTSSRWPRGAPS